MRSELQTRITFIYITDISSIMFVVSKNLFSIFLVILISTIVERYATTCVYIYVTKKSILRKVTNSEYNNTKR